MFCNVIMVSLLYVHVVYKEDKREPVRRLGLKPSSFK